VRNFAVCGRAEDGKGCQETMRYPGLIVFRWDALLFFANAERDFDVTA
jgi:hypothetical protein